MHRNTWWVAWILDESYVLEANHIINTQRSGKHLLKVTLFDLKFIKESFYYSGYTIPMEKRAFCSLLCAFISSYILYRLKEMVVNADITYVIIF